MSTERTINPNRLDWNIVINFDATRDRKRNAKRLLGIEDNKTLKVACWTSRTILVYCGTEEGRIDPDRTGTWNRNTDAPLKSRQVYEQVGLEAAKV